MESKPPISSTTSKGIDRKKANRMVDPKGYFHPKMPIMEPGFYVVRLPRRGLGSKLTIESICFRTTISREHAIEGAKDWCDFIQSQYPKDEVFVIERVEP